MMRERSWGMEGLGGGLKDDSSVKAVGGLTRSAVRGDSTVSVQTGRYRASTHHRWKASLLLPEQAQLRCHHPRHRCHFRSSRAMRARARYPSPSYRINLRDKAAEEIMQDDRKFNINKSLDGSKKLKLKRARLERTTSGFVGDFLGIRLSSQLIYRSSNGEATLSIE